MHTSAVDSKRRKSGSPDPAGELDEIAETEVRGKGAHRPKHFAVSGEYRVPVVASPAQPCKGAQCVVDAILRTHDSDVDE